MDVKRLLGANLKRLRTEAGLSQEELALATGVHRTYVSGVERGLRNPTVTIVAKLAEGVGAEPSALLDAPVADGELQHLGQSTS
ncbi:MAG: helix-turn-helix transcriptional regulator [Pseudomonadota bacterium]